MPKRILGDGTLPCRLMIIGERPGSDEHEQGLPFVGPAGQELWSRIWKLLRLSRSDFYVTNLVKTFSTEPPTADEIARDARTLRVELLQCRPEFILTIGFHAARALLPQFADVNGEFFQGLAFPFTYGTRTAIVVPAVHASAALLAPEHNQNPFSDDIRAFGRVIKGEQGLHRSRLIAPYRVGLAGFGREGLTLGVDTEGSQRSPECVTVADSEKRVVLEEVYEHAPSRYLGAALRHARRLCIHNSPHDVPILEKLGLGPLPRVDDTMLMAYLLALPQSLKVLAFRTLGWQMAEYADLVDPIDDAQVRACLEAQWQAWQAQVAALVVRAERRATRTAEGTRVTKKAIAAQLAWLRARHPEIPPTRVLSGLRRMIDHRPSVDVDADATD